MEYEEQGRGKGVNRGGKERGAQRTTYPVKSIPLCLSTSSTVFSVSCQELHVSADKRGATPVDMSACALGWWGCGV